MKPVHTIHRSIVTRLKKADGHLHATIGMFEEQRTCLELAQQLNAVEAAVSNAKHELIHEHIENCLQAPVDEQKLTELKQLAKYL